MSPPRHTGLTMDIPLHTWDLFPKPPRALLLYTVTLTHSRPPLGSRLHFQHSPQPCSHVQETHGEDARET